MGGADPHAVGAKTRGVMSKPRGLTVLLIDHSVIIRRLLGQLLAGDARIERVLEASDAAEGYSLFKVCRPDAVVLELELPDLHGLEILKRIKASGPSCALIVLTNTESKAARAECLRRGADSFLTKEAGLWTVANTIAELCRTASGEARRSRFGTQNGEESRERV